MQRRVMKGYVLPKIYVVQYDTGSMRMFRWGSVIYNFSTGWGPHELRHMIWLAVHCGCVLVCNASPRIVADIVAQTILSATVASCPCWSARHFLSRLQFVGQLSARMYPKSSRTFYVYRTMPLDVESDAVAHYEARVYTNFAESGCPVAAAMSSVLA